MRCFKVDGNAACGKTHGYVVFPSSFSQRPEGTNAASD